MTTADAVRESLRGVVDPCSAATGSNLDIVEMGLVKSIDVSEERVSVRMRLTTPACHMIPFFITEIRSHVRSNHGVSTVDVDTDDGTEWTDAMMSDEAKRRRQAVLDGYEARYATDSPGPSQE